MELYSLKHNKSTETYNNKWVEVCAIIVQGNHCIAIVPQITGKYNEVSI